MSIYKDKVNKDIPAFLNMCSLFSGVYIAMLLFAFLIATEGKAQSENVISSSIENPRVHGYLNNVVYSGFIYRDRDYTSFSKVTSYNNATGLDYRLDQPSPLVVPVPVVSATEIADGEPVMTLIYADEKDKDYNDTIAVMAETEEVEVWNLIPGRTYQYKFVDNDGNEIESGKLKPEGTMRMIRLENGANIRDIGGWKTLSGKSLKYGKIIRGAELDGGWSIHITDEEKQELRRIGIGAELDLRNANNLIDGLPMPCSVLGEDAAFLHLPMVDNEQMLPNYPKEFFEAFNFILNNMRNDVATYIHCTYGADRCGTLIALIESLCEVELQNIYKDYELSSFSSFVSGVRYYYIINRRIVRMLDIPTPDLYYTYVMDYLTNEVGLTEDMITEFRDLLIDKGEEETPIVPTAITSHKGNNDRLEQKVYSVGGNNLTVPVKGLNIVRMADGSFRKVVY